MAHVDNIDNIRIKVSGNVIEYVNVYKYLGIQLDSKLSFNNQFNDTYKLDLWSRQPANTASSEQPSHLYDTYKLLL